MNEKYENVLRALEKMHHSQHFQLIVKQFGCRAGHFVVCDNKLLHYSFPEKYTTIKPNDIVVQDIHIYTTTLCEGHGIWYFAYDRHCEKTIIGINVETGQFEYVATIQGTDEGFDQAVEIINSAWSGLKEHDFGGAS